MNNTTTYELTISFRQTLSEEQLLLLKSEVITWLKDHGEESFVEGTVDNIEVDYDYDRSYEQQFADMGGEIAALVLYKYTKETLDQLASGLVLAFGENIVITRGEVATEQWLHGWKENFHPFAARKFVVHPPWELPSHDMKHLIPLLIEPGVAFGTGHHATTRLCLNALCDVVEGWQHAGLFAGRPTAALDVGTGTGILSIAALKLGIHSVHATDIDLDAVGAARENAKMNGVSFPSEQGSCPPGMKFDLVIANILAVVLHRIFAELVQSLNDSGLLMLSGLLVEDVSEFDLLAEKYGLKRKIFTEDTGWALLVYGK